MPRANKKFGTGGAATITRGGQKQINKQETRFGSVLGNEKNVPNINLNKYIGKKEGGDIMVMTKPSKMGKPVMKPGMSTAKDGMKKPTPMAMPMMKKGGMMKDDMAQDKKMVKKAVKMHDDQLHGGKKTDLSKLKKGGCTKMARGGGIEVRGKTKGTMVKMCGGGMKKGK
jgi:hypothetical protein